jgi:hypothetical protein
MLKKLTLLGLLVLIPTITFGYSVYDVQIKEAKKNVQYSPIQKHERDYQEIEEYSFKPVENVYDPKLIELTSFTPISDKDFDAKMAKDEKTIKRAYELNPKDPEVLKRYKELGVE